LKKFYSLGFVIFIFSISFGQRYGNEWINHSQTYFKFPLVTEGVYRIDSTTLSQYFNLNSINPKNFQVFLKGKEQFVFINGEIDDKINNGDFIEFYANPHAGEVDSMIYKNIKYIPNPYLPLFNDTVYAFITLNNSINNKRYTLETDTNSAAYPVGNYVYSEKIYSPITNSYNREFLYDNYISDPNYTQAEGKGLAFAKGNSVISNFTSLNTYTALANLSLQVTVNYSGLSKRNNTNPDHQIRLSYLDQNNVPVQIGDTLFYGFAPIRQQFSIPVQNISSFSNFTLSSIANATFSDFQNSTMLHYLKIYYPQQLNLNGVSFQKFAVDDNTSSNKSFFNFSNFNYGGSPSVVLLDYTNGKRISTVLNGAFVRAVIPNGGGRKACVMAAENSIINVNALQPISTNGIFLNHLINPVRTPFVIIYHPSLLSSANSYANYRKSLAGGNYEVLLVPVNSLYEQFSHGVNAHPAAIRNLARFLQDTLAIKPAYFLLLGKGIKLNDINTPNHRSQNFIPTMGQPSSDNLLTSALTQTNAYFPEIPIGRIAALTNQEVNDYLDKVKQHESSGQVDWKKRVLHFVGGNDQVLADRLDTYMHGYENTIKDTLYGAQVFTYKKNTTSPIQTQISDSIRNVINYGAALLNFFGHGHEQGFDQAIDDPDQYQNAGKYPFVIANSCYSGNIHVYGRTSVSQRFVFAKQKGSIGFLATTDYGFDNSLDNYNRGFYRALGVTKYNQSIGNVVKEAAYLNSLNNDGLTPMVGLDMTLHGDPSIVLSNGSLPDYQISNSDVIFDLKKHTDSIGVSIVIRNGAKAVRDSISVRISRNYANNDTSTIVKNIIAPFYRDTLKLFLFTDFNRGIGLNQFKVTVDYGNRIQESNENNNSTIGTVDLFVPGGDVLPVYPYKYAVVPKTNSITLKASTTDPFAPSTKYKLELDTNDSFNFPIASTYITSSGGVLEWLVNLPFPDSTVYYWRVSRDSISAQKSFAWRESSFQTIGLKTGWSQAHFNQFKTNGYQFVTYKPNLRQFNFENSKYTVAARSGIFPNLFLSYFNSYFNNVILDSWSPMFNGWNFAVFDSASGQPWRAKQTNSPFNGAGEYNNCASKGGRNVFSFGTDGDCSPGPPMPTIKNNIENFLNLIPQNSYVLGYLTALSPPYADIKNYSNALYTAFESLGVGSIRTAPDSVGYVFFGKKGMAPGQAQEKIGANKKSIVFLTDSFSTSWNSGYVASEIIGPSFKWNSLHWQVKSIDPSGGDTTILKLVGIRLNGQKDTLQTFVQDSSNVLALYNYIDAAVYPYLQLVALMRDNIHRTSPQLKRWQVMFDEAPECAINPLKGFASINDSLMEGDQVSFRFPIENIGRKDFKDSLVITYWLEDNQRNKVPLPDKIKTGTFASGQVLIDTVTVNSYQLRGNNRLWLHVNPIQHPRYQNEQAQFNNIGNYPFKVQGDVTNPLLDVTFDGNRILNGDIVSAKPNILITLKDENKFLAINDTNSFTIFLLQPGQSTQQRVYFAQGLEFTPAQLPKNSASIRYQPALPNDGTHMLIVQAHDRSKNAAGATEYKIQFEVNNKPSVTQVLNYPNPFSTSTRFVFTLTGSEIPEVFTIQIMTVTGKLVREITRAELGNLRIGRNITDYAWDGRDNYGDRLANGVYLYRVKTKLNGEDIEKRVSAADQFFTKEFGKMVLMR